MKKNLFLIGLAAIGMLFTSCSNDETVEVKKNTNAIQFKSFVNNSTRATDLTTTNLVDFQVWGIMKKDNQIASRSLAHRLPRLAAHGLMAYRFTGRKAISIAS